MAIRFSFCVVFVLAASPDLAFASPLYGGNSGGEFFSIDPGTGNPTTIGTPLGINALAFHPSTGVLFGGNSGGQFFSIDPGTGNPTIIATPLGINALAFHPSTGVLFGGNSGGQFFSIDPGSGIPTMIATPLGINALGFQPIPEPSSLTLSLFGLPFFLFRRRK